MNTIYRDGKMKTVDLATMKETTGCANRKLLAKAIDWAWANKSAIQAEWDKLNGV